MQAHLHCSVAAEEIEKRWKIENNQLHNWVCVRCFQFDTIFYTVDLLPCDIFIHLHGIILANNSDM